MTQRPLSITIISWILIVLAILGFAGTLLALSVPEGREVMEEGELPAEAHIAISFIGLAVLVTSGVGMLKGLNWARMLYVAWTGVSLLVGFLTTTAPATLIPPLVFFLVIVFFLFRPAANDYFRRSPESPGAEDIHPEEGDSRRGEKSE